MANRAFPDDKRDDATAEDQYAVSVPIGIKRSGRWYITTVYFGTALQSNLTNMFIIYRATRTAGEEKEKTITYRDFAADVVRGLLEDAESEDLAAAHLVARRKRDAVVACARAEAAFGGLARSATASSAEAAGSRFFKSRLCAPKPNPTPATTGKDRDNQRGMCVQCNTRTQSMCLYCWDQPVYLCDYFSGRECFDMAHADMGDITRQYKTIKRKVCLH